MTSRTAATDRYAVRNFPNSIRFNGGTGKVDVTGSNLPIVSSSAYSIEFWVKAHAVPNADRYLYTEGNTGDNNPFFSIYQTATNPKAITVRLRDNASADLIGATGQAGNILVETGEWFHVGWTDNNGAGKLYINGELDSADMSYTFAASTFNTANIGRLVRVTGSNTATHFITRSNAYNRELTAAEMRAIVFDNSYPTGNVAEYKFTDGSGTTLTDTSSNGNGTISGTLVTWETDAPFKARSVISTNRTAISQNRWADPRSLPGLALWLDASDTSTIDDSTATPDVDSITDKSDNALVFSQGTEAWKPHTGITVNGLNAISFDGTNDYLRSTSAAAFTGTKGHFFTVLHWPNTVKNIWFSSADEATIDHRLQFVENTDRVDTLATIGGSTTAVVGTPAMVGGTTYVIMQSSDGDDWRTRTNGSELTVSPVAGSNTGNWFGDVANRDNLVIGALVNSAGVIGPGEFYLCEMIYYDGVDLTNPQINLVENYLRNKWGV